LRLPCSLTLAELSQPTARFVHKRLATRTLLRRVIALVAAYAITLAGLVASFGAVRSAAADTTVSGSAICHTARLDHQAPTGGDSNDDCNSSCCIGCLVLLAALPPAPTASVAIEGAPGEILALPTIVRLSSRPQTRSHQSRAPPETA
jgi:hypothetical protein